MSLGWFEWELLGSKALGTQFIYFGVPFGQSISWLNIELMREDRSRTSTVSRIPCTLMLVLLSHLNCSVIGDSRSMDLYFRKRDISITLFHLLLCP